MTKYKPADLQVSVHDYSPTQWKWMLTVGNSPPVRSGVVTGTRDNALRVGHERRSALIAKGQLVSVED